MKLFLTGISGTLGSWMAAEALRRGWQVTALMRDRDLATARRRVERVLSLAGAGIWSDRVEIVRGDLAGDQFWPGQEIAGLKDITLICHCAACTRFDQAAADLAYRTNVQGTARVLKLAKRWQVGLIHISTAYICGKREGLAREDKIYTGQSFNNVYEESKCQAEMLVSQWAEQNDLPVTVLRPSIVLGDWHQGRIVHFNTIYHIMRFFELAANELAGQKLRVIGRARASKNMIPVDYFARAAWTIIERGITGTYHLTNPEPISIGGIRDVFAELFNCQQIELIESKDFERCQPNRVERALANVSEYYKPYMHSEPVFDRTNTQKALAGLEVPVMDLDYYRRLLGYARKADWGRNSEPLGQYSSDLKIFEKYFSEFLIRWQGRALLEKVRKLTVTFSVSAKEAKSTHWTVQIRKGILEGISNNGHAHQCGFVIESSAFRKVVSGELAPQRAFFDQRVEIEGDIEMGLKLISVMAAFFKKYPFSLGDK